MLLHSQIWLRTLQAQPNMSNINPLLNRDPKLNPYRKALALFLSRFYWDLSFSSWSSRRKLMHYKNRFAGEKAVILCNGPSLLQVDFEGLAASGVYTFGLNKINLLFPKVAFRPSCIVAVNKFVIEQNFEFYQNTEIPLFLDSKASRMGLLPRKNVHFVHSANMPGEFARDCSLSVFQGYTVTFVAMQLAFHMGFKHVALVGCDHNFSRAGVENATVKAEEKDLDHFDPEYFSGAMKWQLPDLFQSEVSYKLAYDFYKYSERTLSNCTQGGYLDVLPRMPLEKFLRI